MRTEQTPHLLPRNYIYEKHPENQFRMLFFQMPDYFKNFIKSADARLSRQTNHSHTKLAEARDFKACDAATTGVT